MDYIFTFLEGIASFISPCMLPMIPIYVSYFIGDEEEKSKKKIINSIGFVLGFTIYSSLASTFPVLLFGIEKGTMLISAVVGLIIGVIFYIIGPWVIDRFKYIAKLMDKEIS